QRLVACRLGHLGQRLHEPLLGVVEVLKLVEEQGVERVELLAAEQAHASLSFPGLTGDAPARRFRVRRAGPPRLTDCSFRAALAANRPEGSREGACAVRAGAFPEAGSPPPAGLDRGAEAPRRQGL